MILVLRDPSSKYRRPDRYEPHVAKGTGQVTRVWGHMCPLGPGPSSHVNHGGVKATGGLGGGWEFSWVEGRGEYQCSRCNDVPLGCWHHPRNRDQDTNVGLLSWGLPGPVTFYHFNSLLFCKQQV